MIDARRTHRVIAAFLGAVETSALWIAMVALLSMGSDGLDRLFAAYVFLLLLPVAVIVGIVLGIRSVRSVSHWGFARPRQVVISIVVAFFLLGFNSLFREMGLIRQSETQPLQDPFATASADQLVKTLRDPRPDNRARAAQELVQRNHPLAGDLILSLLQDGDGAVRGRAVVLLGQMRDRRAVDRIITLLDDPDLGIQLAAVRSLGEIGDNRAVSPLLAVLSRPNFSGVVAEALAKIGDQRAVGPLISFLEGAKREDETQWRNWAIASLEKLSGQQYGDDVVRWRQWYEAGARK